MRKGKVYTLDVLEFFKQISDKSVDLIVTDPPYNSNLIKWDKKDNEWQLSWLNEAYRILKPGGSFYCFFAPMNMFEVEKWFRERMTLKNIIVWHHPNLYGAGQSYGKDRYKSTWDVVFYGVKGRKAKHGKNVSSTAYKETGKGFDVMIFPQPRPLLHKGQKPLALIERFVICSSIEGDLVCDPFVGVGTTAIACQRLGRKFIVNDNNFEFTEITIKRLEVCNDLDELKRLDKELWNLKKNRQVGKIEKRK